MSNQLFLIIIFFLAINVVAFLVMLFDKIKSGNNNAERISEGLMFFLATVFGSVGVYAGMFVFRHKTRKWYFIIGIPMLIVQNIAFLFLVYMYLSGSVS